MSKIFPAVAALLLVTTIWSFAQSQEPDYRAEFPAGDAQWSVKLLNDAGAKEASAKENKGRPQLKQVDIVRQGPLRRDTLVWTDGVRAQSWWSGATNYVFFETRGNEAIHGMKATQRSEARYDQSFFSWVDKSSYVGNRKLGGKEFWFFERKVTNKLPDGGRETETQRAWIDPETARPQAWSNGQVTASFEFTPLSPDFRLVMPPNFAEEFDRYKAYTTPPVRVKRR